MQHTGQFHNTPTTPSPEAQADKCSWLKGHLLTSYPLLSTSGPSTSMGQGGLGLGNWEGGPSRATRLWNALFLT